MFMSMVCEGIRGWGQWRSVSVSEGFSHRRQQAPGQERQAETALHFQRGATLHRGMFYSAAILNVSWQFCASALFFGERLILISISLLFGLFAERGLHRGEDQVWSGERLHRQLDEEKNLWRLQRDHGVRSQTPSTGQGYNRKPAVTFSFLA